MSRVRLKSIEESEERESLRLGGETTRIGTYDMIGNTKGIRTGVNIFNG